MRHPSHGMDQEHGRPGFPQTHWDNVEEARGGGDGGRRRQAMARLLEAYWQPAYSFVRRRGYDAEEARDLTQSFFTAFLERDFLRYVDPERGQFRAFLRTALEHHLADERDRARAKKRGGGVPHVPLEFLQADRKLEPAARSNEHPERMFRRKCALAVVSRGLEALRARYEEAGRLREYDVLVPRLLEQARGGPTYAELGARLKTTEIDVNNRLHRMRKLYREAILTELRALNVSDRQAEEELRELFSAIES